MSKKILLIEDHPQMRQITAKSVRHLGYDLLEAEDGRQESEWHWLRTRTWCCLTYRCPA
jgi:CheY-like chemotaxis protein